MNDHPLPHDTRAPRRLELPARMAEARGAKLRRALYVDCETTGFSVERGEVIELAMLPFVYDGPEGRVVEVLHDEPSSATTTPDAPSTRPSPPSPGSPTRTSTAGTSTPRPRAPSSQGPTSSSPTTRGSTARSSSASSPRSAPCPGRARCARSRAPRSIASRASTGSSPATGTAPLPTARSGCGCSRKRSRTRTVPCSPRSLRTRGGRPCACGPPGPRSTPTTRSGRGAIGGCPGRVAASTARGGPSSPPSSWARSSSGSGRTSTRAASPTSPSAALRLWKLCQPLRGSHAERYLRALGIVLRGDRPSLRFHPRLFYRDANDAHRELPALVAAATSEAGDLTGVERIYLDPDRPARADVPRPSRSLGRWS